MTKNKPQQRIHISIAFGDAILPVIECADGHQRVPLKVIVDQIGAQWAGQRRKIDADEYLKQRLGANIETSRCLNKPQLCIRLDRVEAFLNTLNPKMISSKGNSDTAKWLEAKHGEWDDVIHNYEQSGVAHSNDSAISELVRIDRIKNPELKRLASIRANKLYSLDIPLGKQSTMDFK